MKGIHAGISISLLLLAGCTTEQQRADQAFVNHDYKTAVADYQELAAGGDAAAERQLAYLYYSGLGVQADDAVAEHWYEKAAMDGDISSAHNLARHFLPPNTDPPDYAQAFKWLKVCADHYDPYCELQVSIYYENGMGVLKDRDEALHWLNMFIGKTNMAGASIQYKYQGGDNIGGFMAAMRWVLFYSPYYAETSRYAGSGKVEIGFGDQDGKAVDVEVVKSCGNAEADAAAADVVRKAPLPPVLASLHDIKRFIIVFNFGEVAPGVVKTQ